MQPWNIVDGPREYRQHGSADIDVGWAWDIARGNAKRTVRVEVAGGRLNMPDLPEESMAAIASHGRSALSTFLGEDDPPGRIVITSTGISRGTVDRVDDPDSMPPEYDEGGEG